MIFLKKIEISLIIDFFALKKLNLIIKINFLKLTVKFYETSDQRNKFSH